MRLAVLACLFARCYAAGIITAPPLIPDPGNEVLPGVTVRVGGLAVGTQQVIDLATGNGVLMAVSDTGESILIQPSSDTSIIASRSGAQAGTALRCASTSNSGSAYTCFMEPALGQYTAGMLLNWTPDVDGAGGSTTLDVDVLGGVAVKLADGATDPAAGEIIGGRLYPVWYDGTVFRVLGLAAIGGLLGEAQPDCNAVARGRVWFVLGAQDVADRLEVCSKSDMEAYAWRALF